MGVKVAQTQDDFQSRKPGRPPKVKVAEPKDTPPLKVDADKAGMMVQCRAAKGVRLFENSGVVVGGEVFTTTYKRAKQLGDSVEILDDPGKTETVED